MSIRNLYMDISGDGSGMDDVQSIEIDEGYKQASARFKIETRSVGTFGLNDQIIIDIGYDGDHAALMYGYIDSITATDRPGTYEVVGRDIIKKAIDHFIVSTDLENPWSRRNISAENLVRDLLSEASITDYSGDASSFTFGVNYPAEFQLISSWDAIERICNIIAWRCYAKGDTVYFKNLQPVPVGATAITLQAGTSGNISTISYEYSTDNLRNKVVVFGRDGIYAEDSAVSPYLPTDFYKTAIVSSELIDTQSMADDSATYNLALYNKLTEVVKVDVEGNPSLRARDTIECIESFTGVSGDWFVYSVSHRIGNDGYTTTAHLTR